MYLGTLSLLTESKPNFAGSEVDLVRYGEILGPNQTRESFVVNVGYHHESGEAIIEDDDVKVAKKVIKKLEELGYKVIPNDRMPQLATFTPEELTVLSGAYQLERITNEHS